MKSASSPFATEVLQNICIAAAPVPLKNGHDCFVLVAMDEFSRYAITFDIMHVNNMRTWAAFIRTKVLADKRIRSNPKPITFFLSCDSEAIPKMMEELPEQHAWLEDDGRCASIVKPFFEGIAKRIGGE